MSKRNQPTSVDESDVSTGMSPDVDADARPRGGVVDGLGDATTVLVLESPAATDRDEVCRSFFLDGRLTEGNVLLVSLAQQADERLELFRGEDLPFPRNLAVVSAEDGVGATRTETGSNEADTGVAVRTVSDPSALPKLGMSITGVLDGWPDDEGVLLCFDSLTELLRRVELQRVYRFVHILSDRLAGLDAQIHVHLDGEACDERTLATLDPLFDAIVEVPARDNDE
jgi:hypothetical protein